MESSKKDLTILFLTCNLVPNKWAEYHKKVLLEAVGNRPLITISRKPLDFGMNLLQTEEQTHSNIYKQMLRGAKLATTPYISVAEDDTLYHKDHFDFYRPPLDTFAYNLNRWSLYTWGEPTYSFKIRKSNCSCILPREEAISELEERFAKYPNGIPHNLNGELGYENVERRLGTKIRKFIYIYSNISVIQFDHIYGTRGKNRSYTPTTDEAHEKHIKRKRMGFVRAYDIPYWGKSKELVKNFI